LSELKSFKMPWPTEETLYQLSDGSSELPN
jgi:hypothetical protein